MLIFDYLQIARRVGPVAAKVDALFPCQSINYYLAAAVVGGKMWAESTPHGPTLVNIDIWDVPMNVLYSCSIGLGGWETISFLTG